MTAGSRFVTVGVIAAELGVPLHRVKYILQTRKILPLGKAGNSHVYDGDVVAKVAAVLGIKAPTGVKH